jgi:hypothetical protein
MLHPQAQLQHSSITVEESFGGCALLWTPLQTTRLQPSCWKEMRKMWFIIWVDKYDHHMFCPPNLIFSLFPSKLAVVAWSCLVPWGRKHYLTSLQRPKLSLPSKWSSLCFKIWVWISFWHTEIASLTTLVVKSLFDCSNNRSNRQQLNRFGKQVRIESQWWLWEGSQLCKVAMRKL